MGHCYSGYLFHPYGVQLPAPCSCFPCSARLLGGSVRAEPSIYMGGGFEVGISEAFHLR